ncbi:uncharacterized protein ARMOST_20764 [Armillaria ostoyae]|uniref:Uncharacterized protein n=1 Tax=Armillaria ostoyae TaxID=47428 RepID=A0A284S895_ARMOS|nr:uncharacterized protein ARMOST_20764 [Armillaria ostoyae]
MAEVTTQGKLISSITFTVHSLLSCPITRLDLAIGTQSPYYALKLTPLLHLEDLRITDNSPSRCWEMLRMVEAKKSLRNLEIKSPSLEIRELLRSEILPEDLTISFSLSRY